MVGFLFVYAAAFTYESTDKRIQNTLEEAWLALAFKAHTPVAFVHRLLEISIDLTARLFDLAFGASLLSIRTTAVALCYAYGAANLSGLMLPMLSALADLDPEQVQELLPTTGPIAIAMVCFGLGTISVVHIALRWVTYAGAGIIIAIPVLAGWAAGNLTPELIARYPSSEDLREIALASAVSLMYGMGVVHAVRWSVYLSAKRESPRLASILMIGTLMIALVPFAALLGISAAARQPQGELATWAVELLDHEAAFFVIFYIGGTSALWGLGALVVAAIVVLVLAHLAVWPATRLILMKTLYSAQRHELIRKKPVLWTIGVSLLTASVATPLHLLIRVFAAVR